MKEVNEKHFSIKFNFKFDKVKIEFVDTLVYTDQECKSENTLFEKPKKSQNFLNAKSEHPYSFKKRSRAVLPLQFKECAQNFQIKMNIL